MTQPPLSLSPVHDLAPDVHDPHHIRFALFGHDLRSAVSDVLGGLRMIAPDTLPTELRPHFDRVRIAGEEMARILEDALVLSDTQSAQPAHHPVQAERFFHDIATRWHGRATEDGLNFRMTLSPDMPPILFVDRCKVERIIGNLLSNALKHTDQGEILMLVAPTPDSTHLQITIRDDGPGFSPDILGRLFVAGARGDDAQHRPGQGLGLYISHALALEIGATLDVKNRIDNTGADSCDHNVGAVMGADVVLTVPLQRPHVALNARVPDLSHFNILVVEDSRVQQLMVGEILSLTGANHDIAETGREALALLDENVYDLALIDIELPEMSGIDVMHAIRAAHSRYRDLPVVACTAYTLRCNRDAIMAAGANAIVTKPLLKSAPLFAAIGTVLAAHGRTDVIVDAPANVESDSDDTTAFTAAALDLETLLRGPSATARAILDDLLTDLATIERNLVAAKVGPDYNQIQIEMHKLIAITATIGATKIENLGRRLQAAAEDRSATKVALVQHELMDRMDRLIHRLGNRLQTV